MNENKFYSNLGLAMRAGKVITGEETVVEAVRKGEAKLVIVAEDASAGTYKKVNDKCSYYKVPLYRFGERGDLGASIGKEARVVVGVTDQGLAALLTKSLEEKHGGGHY